MSSKLIWGTFVFYILAAIAAAWLKSFDAISLIYGALIFGVFAVNYAYLILTKGREDVVKDALPLQHEIYDLANRQWQMHPQGRPLKWGGGRDRTSIPKVYNNPVPNPEGGIPKQMLIQALMGHDTDEQRIVLYFDLLTKRLVGYNTRPEPKMNTNPHYGFDPFSEEQRMKMMSRRPYSLGHRRKRITSVVDDGMLQPDDSLISEAIGEEEEDDGL